MEGMKNAERKPVCKTPFVATLEDDAGETHRIPLPVVSYNSSEKERVQENDRILREVGTTVSFALPPKNLNTSIALH